MSNILANTDELLVMGGDARIALNAPGGVNRYGCGVLPVADLLDFASSTASVISPHAYQAANQLRVRLVTELGSHLPATLYARELSHMRKELLELCRLENLPEPDVVFAASGTDLHRIAAQLSCAAQGQAVLAIMVDETETGSGVCAALQASSSHIQIATVTLRHADGTPRDSGAIDAEFTSLAQQAAAAGQQVLLIHVDVSKTGMIAPSYACTAALKTTLGKSLDVLIDACQFRIAPATLRACLERGYNVALTGSKFIGGPSFSGALLIPAATANRLRHQLFLHEATAPNFGLLLRWQAALCELRRFRNLNTPDISNFLHNFAQAIKTRLNNDPAFAEVGVAKLDRSALHAETTWDDIQTIFPFQLYRSNKSESIMLGAEQTKSVYRRLATTTPRCQFGQAVNYGNGLYALRLCLSTNLIEHALANKNAGDDIIAKALAALDHVSRLASFHPVRIVRRNEVSEISPGTHTQEAIPSLNQHQRIAHG
ncbi:MAG: hypothetical protein WCD45_01195 [Gallionella sp.]